MAGYSGRLTARGGQGGRGLGGHHSNRGGRNGEIGTISSGILGRQQRAMEDSSIRGGQQLQGEGRVLGRGGRSHGHGGRAHGFGARTHGRGGLNQQDNDNSGVYIENGSHHADARIQPNGDGQGRVRPPSPWRNSKAKKKLTTLLKDESSWVQIMTPYQVYCFDDDFRRYDKNNFINNFKSLKEKIEINKAAVEFDRLSISHDKALYPQRSMNKRGKTRYDGSEAQAKLKEDVNAGKTVGVKPKTLHETPGTPYKSLTLAQLRRHKYHEERKLKEGVYWQQKRNDKGRKDHEKQVARAKD